MTYHVRFTEEAENDLVRLYEFVLARDEADWQLAERALEAIRNAIRSLELTPFSFRKTTPGNPFCVRWSFRLARAATSPCTKSNTKRPSPFWRSGTNARMTITETSGDTVFEFLF